MIESVVTTFRLRCDKCRSAWVQVPALSTDEARLAAQGHGWGYKIGIGDVCPRCVRHTRGVE